MSGNESADGGDCIKTTKSKWWRRTHSLTHSKTPPFGLVIESAEKVAKIVGTLPSRVAEALAHHDDLAEFSGVKIPEALKGGGVEAQLRWDVANV